MRSTPIAAAAFIIATACLVTNPVVAQAARDLITGKDIKDGTITSADVRDRSLLLEDFKRGQLKPGPTGLMGVTGPAGATGESGFSKIVAIDEKLADTVSAPAGLPTLLTPEITVEVGELQQIMLSGSAGLGASAPQSVVLGLCLTNSSGVPATYPAGRGLVGSSIDSVGANSITGTLPPGTYTVAPCAAAPDGPLTLDNTGKFVGWIAVVNVTGSDVQGTGVRTPIVAR